MKEFALIKSHLNSNHPTKALALVSDSKVLWNLVYSSGIRYIQKEACFNVSNSCFLNGLSMEILIIDLQFVAL